MTNYHNTICLNSDTHGAYRVHADHLTRVIHRRALVPLSHLVKEINSLVGVDGDYDDLDRVSAMIVLSYLTGGIAD